MVGKSGVPSVSSKIAARRRRIPRVYILIGLAAGSWALFGAAVVLFLWVMG
ncbi:MAG: hypothetical protein K2X64_06380 [Rhodocyclaceae bacterium]|nr:hypothetical protein [Rhodocyclaceae bacterium]